jgi:hypothetical protein
MRHNQANLMAACRLTRQYHRKLLITQRTCSMPAAHREMLHGKHAFEMLMYCMTNAAFSAISALPHPCSPNVEQAHGAALNKECQ